MSPIYINHQLFINAGDILSRGTAFLKEKKEPLFDFVLSKLTHHWSRKLHTVDLFHRVVEDWFRF